MILGIEDPVMEGNAPADADGRTLAPRLELRREVDNPVVVTRDPRGTARGTAMDRTAGDIPERVVPNKSGDIVTSGGDLKTQDSPDILQPTTFLELIDRVFPNELRGVVFFILANNLRGLTVQVAARVSRGPFTRASRGR
jgi:hypothetical protein